jgi:hypothetical protein
VALELQVQELFIKNGISNINYNSMEELFQCESPLSAKLPGGGFIGKFCGAIGNCG